MRVSQRLFLAVIPGSIGVLAVAALAYWGRYREAAPEWVIVAAAISMVVSWLMAWGNTRYVARRIEEIAARRTAGSSGDELDSIASAVDQLSADVSTAQADSRAYAQTVAARLDEYAVLLNEGAAAMRQHVAETRLAVHILLEHHFGPLNDNQEELLESARASTEAADGELARLQQIAELDRGLIAVRRDSLRLGDLVQGLRPQLEADAVRAGVTLTVDVQPGMPRITGDRVRLQRAIDLVLRHIVRRTTPGASLLVTASAEPGAARVMIAGGPAPALDADLALARRILEAHGGRIEVSDGGTAIAIPGAT